MRQVGAAELQAGQVLAEAVLAPGGATLCPAGFCLTDSAIARIRGAGVGAVSIDPQSAQTVESVDRRIAALEARFAGAADPVLKQLKSTIEHRLRRLKAQ